MNQGIRQRLDRITNTLFAGGVTNPVTYIEQISYLIFLKLLDEEEDSRAQQARLTGKAVVPLYPDQADRFRWQNWRFKSGKDLVEFVRGEVFPYMASLVQDAPQVAEYFRDAVLEIADPNVLKQVVDEIDSIQFSKLGPDVKGDIYEYLLTYLGKIDSTTLGQFRTPRQIRGMIVEMLAPDLGDTIYDPACGTAGFLIDTLEYVKAKYSAEAAEVPIYGEEWLEARGQTVSQAKAAFPNLQTYRKGMGERIPDWGVLERSIYGTDVSRQMMRIAMMNLVLHGIRNAHLKRANALAEGGGLSEDDISRRYRVVLANPPFAGALPRESIRSDLPTESKKSELLFLALMMESLAPGGRCGVIVPEGALFGSTAAHVRLRRKLLVEFEVLAVVSLPPGVFKPYAGVKTSVLIFRRPVSAPKEGKTATTQVWFYEIQNDGYDPNRIQGGGRPETPDKNDIPTLLASWDAYRASGFSAPPGVSTEDLLPPGSDEPRSWFAMYANIVDRGFTLSAAVYRPRTVIKHSDEDPVLLAREALSLEHEVAHTLHRLLDELGAGDR